MALPTCPNCGANITCGCQRKTSSDGKTVCTSCLNSYELSLKQSKPQTQSDGYAWVNGMLIKK